MNNKEKLILLEAIQRHKRVVYCGFPIRPENQRGFTDIRWDKEVLRSQNIITTSSLEEKQRYCEYIDDCIDILLKENFVMTTTGNCQVITPKGEQEILNLKQPRKEWLRRNWFPISIVFFSSVVPSLFSRFGTN